LVESKPVGIQFPFDVARKKSFETCILKSREGGVRQKERKVVRAPTFVRHITLQQRKNVYNHNPEL